MTPSTILKRTRKRRICVLFYLKKKDFICVSASCKIIDLSLLDQACVAFIAQIHASPDLRMETQSYIV